MPTKKLLIVYYSATGHTERMAEAIGRGAQKIGPTVHVKKVEDCSIDDLEKADGIVIGSPTYFSNVAWRVKKLIDESIVLYRRGRALSGKVGGCFTSSGTHRDGEECIRILGLAFGLHHKMMLLPGIVWASGDSEDEVMRKCENYGAEIARQLLASQ
ncbi:NAD(P)H-dependent oxidoreductase [Candidatus Bathyarchaeota archaeon]|nr:NAD(P)H-dependent oxidoreductase [Candidatus Bathyarchaeota archaeon]